MLLSKTHREVLPKLNRLTRYFATTLSGSEDDYTATPQYPPIMDLSREKVLERKERSVHEEIKAVKTVEEKQIKLNMPRYYGFKCYMLKEDDIPYNSLHLAQHVTRTHIVEKEGLPSFYNKLDVDPLYERIKSDVIENILLEHTGLR